jgi:hypothetical protein
MEVFAGEVTGGNGRMGLEVEDQAMGHRYTTQNA